ncbi:MAG: site-specific integrase [Acidobacteria bacterium]|nr:site-specific integrase [Acidobacteriota bacterium]
MIIKRGRTWTYSIDLGFDGNGKRIRKWSGGHATKKIAAAKHAEAVSKHARSEYVAPIDMTVGEWLTSWLDGRMSIADTTRVGYRYEVARITKSFGPRRLQKLTPQTISGFYRELTESGLSAKTVKNCNAVFHKALKDAVRDGVLIRNPADGVELPRSERKEMEVWSADELRQFLSHTKTHRLHAAWLLLCNTGVRRSELLGLRWESVDWDNNRVAIVDTVVPVDNKPTLRIGETKSRRSRRVIALDPETIAVLRTHRLQQNEERIAAGAAYENHDLVVADELGGIVSPDWYTRTTKRLAAEAGVTPLGPHAARHSWASIALAAGTHPKVVQERLGHSSIAITLDRYSHLTEGMDRDAAELVAALIR